MYAELEKFYASRREFDETEAYLRHRARVHEREKREKLKKQGKLEEYLREIEETKPKSPTPEPEQVEDTVLDKALEEYKEWKKQEDLENAKFVIDEKKVAKTAFIIRRQKKIEKRKQEMEEETRALLGYEPIDEPPPFKPKMAGKTGMPSFFFSNLVTQNKKAFASHVDKNKMRHTSVRF